MFVYLTSGTPDYMELLHKKYANENMTIMHGQGNSVLLYETEKKKSVFATPRKFEVLDTVGNIEQRGFLAFHNIPVSEEGRPIFEHRFLNSAHAVKNEPGLIAFRLLRPIKAETYIIITQWAGPHSFDVWKQTQAYKDAFENHDKPIGVNQQHIFTAAPYITTFSAQLPEKKED